MPVLVGVILVVEGVTWISLQSLDIAEKDLR
jgi:hypothetical protein